MTHRTRTLVPYLLLASAAACSAQQPSAPIAADPTPEPAVATTTEPIASPPGRDEAAYRAALVEGRRLHHKKEYAAAVKAFDQALVAAPDDARALFELGWSAMFAGDLARAESVTRRVLAESHDADIRGGAFYNLGRILERRGLVADALASYHQSLVERRNATVTERLEKLQAAAAHVEDSLRAQPLAGPYPTLAAYCSAHVPAETSRFVCDAASDELGEYEGPPAIVTPSAPYEEVRIFVTASPLFDSGEVGSGEVFYHLALRTKAGWFVSDELATVYNPGAFGISASIETSAFAERQVIPGGAPEIVLRFAVSVRDSNMAGAEANFTNSTAELVCGIGASGAPSCTRPLEIASDGGVDYALWRDDQAELGPPPGEDSHGGWSLELAYADGAVELGGARITGDLESLPVEAAAALGHHSIVLP
jgi:Flp pilus assembly protein TadD